MKILAAALLAAVLLVPAARAQSQSDAVAAPEKGSRNLEAWTGGGVGFDVHKVTYKNGVWQAGLRYGWVLTGPHGPGLLRGRFEYAVDAIPIFWVFQPDGISHGFSFDPWITKWDFQARRGIAPYFEVGGGGLISTREVPMGESRFNFTPTAGVGVQLLRGKYYWSVDLRWVHISDADTTPFNPGTNTLGIRIGFGAFTRPKQ